MTTETATFLLRFRMREHLRQHGGDAIPSRQTISRMLKRQAKEVTAHGFPS